MKSDTAPVRVTLRSPINGQPCTFELIPGLPPTLETLIDVLKFQPMDEPEAEPPKPRPKARREEPAA